MLWIGVGEAISVACIGGLIGGCLMAIAHKSSNKCNLSRLEYYWKEDIYILQSSAKLAHHKINEINKKLSTISGVNSVNNQEKTN